MRRFSSTNSVRESVVLTSPDICFLTFRKSAQNTRRCGISRVQAAASTVGTLHFAVQEFRVVAQAYLAAITAGIASPYLLAAVRSLRRCSGGTGARRRYRC
jgi:hypothetical protein